MKLKPIPKGSSISAIDKKKLEKHKAHHSDKHLKSMRMSMLERSTFKNAHKKAMKFVGEKIYLLFNRRFSGKKISVICFRFDFN
jgi:hypothetical protein